MLPPADHQISPFVIASRALVRRWTIVPVAAALLLTLLLGIAFVWSGAAICLFLTASIVQTARELRASQQGLPQNLQLLVDRANQEAADILAAADRDPRQATPIRANVESLVRDIASIAAVAGRLQGYLDRNPGKHDDVVAAVTARKLEMEHQIGGIVQSLCDAHGRLLLVESHDVMSPWLSDQLAQMQQSTQSMLIGTLEVEQLLLGSAAAAAPSTSSETLDSSRGAA